MVIRRSSSTEIQQLVDDLRADGHDADVRRESAIARLRVIGARAVGHLLTELAGGARADTRIAILRALEGQTDVRLVDPIIGALDDPAAEVQLGAVMTARALLESPRGAEVLDRLAAIALDADRSVRVRVAAAGALGALPSRTTSPVFARLREDPEAAIRAAADAKPTVSPAEDPLAAIEAAAGGRLPSDPQLLLYLAGDVGPTAPLAVLHRLVTTLREQEAREAQEDRAAAWRTVRGTVHGALARRDSRVALYDLRESIESTGEPLPHGYLDAAALVGDAACLEAIAAAYVRAALPEPQTAWRAALRAAAHAIATREKLTRRHAAIKRLQGRWGEQVEGLLR